MARRRRAGTSTVRDPAGDLRRQPLLDTLDLDATPPPEAVSTDYHRGRWTLWHLPGDHHRVWLVRDDGRAERWPRPVAFQACA